MKPTMKKVIVVKTKDKPDIFNGGAPDHLSGFNIAMKSCIDRVSRDPEKVIHYDLETGWPTVITKEENQKIIDLYESFKPKLDDSLQGQIIFYGTSGDTNMKTYHFEDIFKHKKI